MTKRGNNNGSTVVGEAKRSRIIEEVKGKGCRFLENFEKVQQGLKIVLKKPGFREALEKTIQNAVKNAKSLRKELYHGLNKEHKGKAWPESVEDWCGVLEEPVDGDHFKKDKEGTPDCFLWEFATWMPNENDEKDESKKWAQRDHEYNEKVYHVICHFHWLITTFDEKTDEKCKPSKDADFNKWLSTYNNVVEMFLDSERSLKKFKGGLTWDEIFNDPKVLEDPRFSGYQLQHFRKNRNTWHTFNQFFYRRFSGANHKNGGISPYENKIEEPKNNQFIGSPAYCTFKEQFDILETGKIEEIRKFPNKKKPEGLCELVTDSGLKLSDCKTHVKGMPVSSIYDLMKLTNHTEDFCGGTYIHYFLSPYDYHRYHVPVTGKVVQAKQIPGYAYLNVTNKNDEDEVDGWMHAPDGATDGYEFVQSRGLIVIDTKYQVDEDGNEYEDPQGPNDIGKVAILPIGMSQVSGVGINENLEGEVVTKGWEFGRFKFGGSDIIMLFDKRAEIEFNYDQKTEKEGKPHYKFGETVAEVIRMNWDK